MRVSDQAERQGAAGGSVALGAKRSNRRRPSVGLSDQQWQRALRRWLKRDAEEAELRITNLVINLDSHEVRGGDSRVQLTPLEFRILYILALKAGSLVRSSELIDLVWGGECEQHAPMLRTHMSHLRSKLQSSNGGAGSITCVSRVGYRLELE
jgi:DNA-binding response OmpR family regulator